MFKSLKEMKESLRPLTEKDRELIEIGKDKFRETCSEFTNSVTSFVMVDAEGETRSYADRACHANVADEDFTPLFIVTMNGTKGRSELTSPIYGDKLEELSPRFVEAFETWFLSSEMYGPYVVDYEEDLFVVRADIPANYLQNILIVTRHFKECSHHSFLSFNKLVENGTLPEVAYLVCFGSNLSKMGVTRDLSTTMFSTQISHRAYSSNITLTSLSNMLKGCIVGTLKSRRSEGETSFFKGRLVFGDYSSELSGGFLEEIILKDEGLRGHLSEFRKNLFKEVFIPNPFKPQAGQTDIRREKPHKLTIEEAIDVVVPYITEHKLLERYLP